MMSYSVQAHSEVRKDLTAIPEPMLSRIRKAINALGENPRPAAAIKMSGYSNLYRVRVGDYRIVYFIHDQQMQIIIVAAVTRGKAYALVKRRLKN